MRTYAQQKAGLTRAVKSGDRQKVRAECLRTIGEWESEEWATAHRVRRGAWPDDWARWERALGDAYPVFQAPTLSELAGEVIL